MQSAVDIHAVEVVLGGCAGGAGGCALYAGGSEWFAMCGIGAWGHGLHAVLYGLPMLFCMAVCYSACRRL